MVLSVPKVTLTLVFLNNFVTTLVSLPMYVNLTHLIFSSLCFCPLLVLIALMIDVSYLLLFRICSIVSCSFCTLSCASWYEIILLCKYLIANTLCYLRWHESCSPEVVEYNKNCCVFTAIYMSYIVIETHRDVLH